VVQTAGAWSDPVAALAQPAAGPAILVVEDDPGLRSLFVQVLTDQGYAVETAGHGRAALDRLEAWRPDLILLDMMMPVMDGRAFREAQLAHPDWRDIPVIVISATSGFLHEEETLGARAILGKPFEFDELLELVERWSRQRA
jgi:CheY-like chemotaxis protein